MQQITVILFALCISACGANMGNRGPNREFIWLDVHDATLKGVSSVIPGSNVKFHAFQGIPYAEPPVMDLRFKPPVRRDLPKTGKHDTTLDIPSCPQYTYRNTETLSKDPLTGREDCLYLNVYVPDKIFVGREIEKAPVMVWIHGGAFIGGSGGRSAYQPDNFMDTEEVILVSINYRLGALGFLCLEDDNTVAGNMGLKDQVAALEWVRNNIELFGGDPDRVTIFGESAGGISVMDLVHSPKAAGLFSAAISQSGPGMLMPFMRQYIPSADYARRFLSEALNCKDVDDKVKIMECLKEAPLYKIMEGTRMFEKYGFTPGVFKPVVDLEFSKDPMLPYNRHASIKGGHHNKVPIMMGGNKDEGAFFTVQFLYNHSKFDAVAEDALSHIPVLLFGTDEGQKLLPSSIVRVWELLRFYRPETEEEREAEELGLGGHFSRKNYRQVKNMFTDMQFLAPIDQTARATAKSQEEPVFYYNYRHEGATGLIDLYGYDGTKHPNLGVGHADELFIEFMPIAQMTNKEDAEMAKKMVKLWTGFASARDHKEWGKQVGWAPVERNERQYGMYHILDNEDLRLPDYSDPIERKVRDRFIFSVDMVNREIMPAGSKRKRVVEVDKVKKKLPPHGGEL